MIIYLTTNNLNGKIYVGKYCGKNKNYLGSGKYIKQAIKKYGKENFSKIILEDGITNHDYLCEREVYWIKFYDATNPKIGYNLSVGGKGAKGFHLSEETREKMSDAKKGEKNHNFGKSPSDETRKKMAENHADFSGKNHPMWEKHHTNEAKEKIRMAKSNPSEETRKNISMAAKNRPPVTDETKRKLSEAKEGINHPMYGKHHSEEARKNMSIATKNKPPITEKTRKKLSESRKGINNPRIIKKEIVLMVLKLLNTGISGSEISKKIHISRITVRKIKNGWYDDIYDLPKDDKEI